MDLREIITVIENLFYNFITWIALYPKTVLLTIFRPGRLREYVTEEYQKPQADRFHHYLNPFVFWLISMILFMWGASGQDSATSTPMTFQAFTLTMVLFAVLPIIFGSLMLTAQHIPLSADQLRRPIYIQMAVFGAAQTILAIEMALSIPLIQLGADNTNLLKTLFALMVMLLWFAVMGVVFLWIPIAEMRIFTKELSRPWTKVLGWVFLGVVLSIILLVSMPSLSGEINMLSGMLRFSP